MQASFAGNAEEVMRLIENGVAANAADYDGRTALVCILVSSRQIQYLLTSICWSAAPSIF
jgi:hypothetical protein